MIALKTEAACGHCPLSVRCTQGKGFLDLYAEPHIRYNVRHCRRCYSVIFDYEHETYICGLIRWGLNFSAERGMRDGYERVWKRIGSLHKATRGCGIVFPHDHPLTHSKPGRVRRGTRTMETGYASQHARKRILDRMGMFADTEEVDARHLQEDGYDDRDCFDHLRDSITHVY